MLHFTKTALNYGMCVVSYRTGSASVNVGETGVAPAFSYSHSRGLFAGVSLDGSVIFSRNEVNHRFYGRMVSVSNLLDGSISPPRAAQPLYDALYEAISTLPRPRHTESPMRKIKIKKSVTNNHDKVTTSLSNVYQNGVGTSQENPETQLGE
jgi:hypothetical protein